MKKKMAKLIAPFCSLFIGLSLTGTTLAAWAVNDEAENVDIPITVGSVSSFDVTFMNADSTVFKTEKVYSGDKLASVPETPTLSGYVFDGWTTDTVDYTETTDNFATKTYTTSVTYYPRFASYGYSINGGNAQHLANAWDINNNISIAHGASLTLGTYIYGKTSLENADDNTLTIPNAGGYALVCNNGSGWTASKASSLDNWSIQRAITITRTGAWTNKNTYARFYKSNESSYDYIMQQLGSSGETYYAYSDYDDVKVEFGAIYSDSWTQDAVLDNYANIQYRTDKFTLNDTTHYDIPDVAYYLTGNFGSVDWGMDANYVLSVDSEDSNHYSISNVSLEAGDKIRVRDNANNWFSSSTWTGCCFSNDGDGNIVLTNKAIYNIDFYINGSNHVIPNPVSYESTFTIVDETLASGESIYLVGLSDNWEIHESLELVAAGEPANTYTLTTNVPADTSVFKLVVYDGNTINWDKYGQANITYVPCMDYSHTYVAPSAELDTVTLWVKSSIADNDVDRVYAWVWSDTEAGKWYYCTHITESWESSGNRHYTVDIDKDAAGKNILLASFNSGSGVNSTTPPDSSWTGKVSQSGDNVIPQALSMDIN